MWTKRITFFSLPYRWCSIDRKKKPQQQQQHLNTFWLMFAKGRHEEVEKTHTNRISATDEWQWNESMWNVKKNDDTKKKPSHDTHNKMVSIDLCEKCVFDTTVCVFFYYDRYHTLCGILFIATINFWMNLSLCFIFCNCAANSFSLAFARGLSDCVWDVVMISGHYFRCFMSGPDKRFNYTCQSHAKAEFITGFVYEHTSNSHATLSD